MEFSWLNLFDGIIVLLILTPNIIYLVKNQSITSSVSIPKWLTVCEQIGRYGCMALMCLPLFVWKFGFHSEWAYYLYTLLNTVFILTYYICWLLYWRKKSLAVGMMLAVIPTCIFGLTGLLLTHWLLVGFAVLFGVAHIWITYLTHVGITH